MRHVIIGAGPSGVTAAETLRKTDPTAEVTIVGAESEPPYSRMAIPYYLIENIDEAGTYLRKRPDHYSSTGIKVLRDRVQSVDPKAQTVTLAGAGALPYERLLVATGSRPLAPPIPGIEARGVHACWTLEDARNIRRLAKPGANVLLMGAGFIGCIILEALAASGANLTVVEMGDRMVPRMLDQTAGNLLKRWCESKGVKVHTSTKVDAIETAGEHLSVRLDNGETVPAHLVVSATGVKPNIECLDGSGVDTDYGVLVDDRMRSNVPEIFAAGDVAQGIDFSTGEYAVQAIQPTAVEHGRVAALNMAGHDAAHQGSLNMNVLDTVGLISSSFGLWMGVDGGDTATLLDESRYRYIQLQFQDDQLVGGQALGLTQHVGVLRGLIQTRTRLGEWKEQLMRDPSRLMEAYLARAQDTARAGQVVV